jgi:hypothetical protein
MIYKSLFNIEEALYESSSSAEKKHQYQEVKRQRIYEINNKLTDLIELNKKMLELHTITRSQSALKEIIGYLESIQNNMKK